MHCAGALLSAAVFLLLFESTHYVATGWDKAPCAMHACTL